MASYSALTIAELLDAFASHEPVPGGGAAAALAGAIGASLLIMVARLPKTRTNTAEARTALDASAARLVPLRDTLRALIDRDSAAYTSVLEAFRLPKETDAEKNARRHAIDLAMQQATETPLETMRACQQVLAEAATIAVNGSPSAASDAAVGIELLLSATRGAGLNVDTNIGSLKDQAYVARVQKERRELEEAATASGRAAPAR